MYLLSSLRVWPRTLVVFHLLLFFVVYLLTPCLYLVYHCHSFASQTLLNTDTLITIVVNTHVFKEALARRTFPMLDLLYHHLVKSPACTTSLSLILCALLSLCIYVEPMNGILGRLLPKCNSRCLGVRHNWNQRRLREFEWAPGWDRDPFSWSASASPRLSPD